MYNWNHFSTKSDRFSVHESLVGPTVKSNGLFLAPRAKSSLRGGYFSCVGCWKLEEGSKGHESWIFKAGGCITSEYENQPTKPTTDRYNQPVTHIGSINWFKPVFSCTRPAGHCKIRSYSIAPSLLEGVCQVPHCRIPVHSRRLSRDSKKFLPNPTHVLVLHGRPMKCPINRFFRVTWPIFQSHDL